MGHENGNRLNEWDILLKNNNSKQQPCSSSIFWLCVCCQTTDKLLLARKPKVLKEVLTLLTNITFKTHSLHCETIISLVMIRQWKNVVMLWGKNTINNGLFILARDCWFGLELLVLHRSQTLVSFISRWLKVTTLHWPPSVVQQNVHPLVCLEAFHFAKLKDKRLVVW